MKVIDFKINKRFGKEFCFYILKTEKLTFIQGSFGWYDDSCFPYCQLNFGMSRIFDIIAQVHKFGFYFELCGRTYDLD